VKVISTRDTEWREVPEPNKDQLMKAKVIAKTTVNNLPAKVGEIVEVDENTFRNLARKAGWRPRTKLPRLSISRSRAS
jgi:hypothetical protein